MAAGLVAFWWNSDQVKSVAIAQVSHYCRQQELQLLDQTMVLRGIWPARDEADGFCLRRRYEFEFTSTGQTRNRGQVTLLGRQLSRLEVEAHILPEQDRRLH
ncbi:MAG: DUF3301 domain-containing protein [Gammaproteobacteria bacterium]